MAFDFGAADDYPDLNAAEFYAMNFLPAEVGSQWTYKIEIGDMAPLRYDEVIWPIGDTAVVSRASGLFSGLFVGAATADVFWLTLQVKGTATQQGPFEYDNGVELEILRDDLGVFEDAEQVFWTISPGEYQARVMEIVTYPAYLAPDDLAQEDGFSARLILLDCLPGVYQEGLVWGEESTDILHSLVHDIQFPQYEGTTVLHFQRVVEYEGFWGGFTEDTWFAEGIGLIRLEQRVDGVISMIWTLE
ncbi:MAG: hypothetical protein K8S97_08370 [Anaerolineae bacterium]|nr:hypothetical protein [Anaerolineae bacterium]